MKATKLLLSAALFTSIASFSFAGPGPQFWARQPKPAQNEKAKAAAPAEPAKSVASCASCACCSDMKKG